MSRNRFEIKVHYNGDEIRPKLDEALEECLAKFGFKRWASGYNIIDKIRDLAFDKEGFELK